MKNQTIVETRPAADWANWALIAALDDKTQCRHEVVELILARFKATVSEHGDQRGPRSFLIATNGGHWGRGDTLAAAALATVKAGAGKTEIALAWLVLNDAAPYVDQGGAANAASAATLLRLGKVGKLGGILAVNVEGAR